MTFSIYLFILLVAVLSMDAFAAGLSYGMEGVRVPFLSIFVIALLSGSMLTASLLAGNILLNLIPEGLTKGISFSILFLLSLYKFYDSFPRCNLIQNLSERILHSASLPEGSRPASDSRPSFLQRHTHQKESRANPGLTTREITKRVNREEPSVLSCREAALLALALSIDNISAGLCTGATSLSPMILLFFTTAVHLLSIRLGLFTGRLLCARSHSFAWLGSAVLMLLAFLRLL